MHPRTKEEAKLIKDLFDKMNIQYEKNIKVSSDEVPNPKTRKAIEDARNGKGKRFSTLTGLFDELKK